MTHGSLFSGIGGFDLASEWMGWDNKFHCENNPFGQKVLKYYWPGAELFEDIKKADFKKYNGTIDIISGGFPCQPYSAAGKRKGNEDDRHLWPEMLRAIKEIQPRWVVGENVLGLLNWSGGLVFHQVQTDLEAEGFIMFPYVLPACAVGAPHRRDRVWFVAHAMCQRSGEVRPQFTSSPIRSYANDFRQICNNASERIISNTKQQRLERRRWQRKRFEPGCKSNGWNQFPTQPPLCSRDDGLPGELVGITFSRHRNESIKGYGNAIVPQVAFQIFKAIQEYENSLKGKK